jgi:hypothetical protein
LLVVVVVGVQKVLFRMVLVEGVLAALELVRAFR